MTSTIRQDFAVVEFAVWEILSQTPRNSPLPELRADLSAGNPICPRNAEKPKDPARLAQ
jgi:hypothetical protein